MLSALNISFSEMKTKPRPHVLLLDRLAASIAGLFNHLDGVQFWIKDLENCYVHANRTLLINYALDDVVQIVGKTDYDLSPAFLADQFWFDDEQVLKGHHVSNRIELVGGTNVPPHWSVTNKVPLRDAHGRIIGTAGTTSDLGADGRAVEIPHHFNAVLERIRDGYRAALSNRELASVSGLSVRAFERKFRQSFHVTPQQYLRKLRVRMACRALVFTEKTFADVAAECGFADQSHFNHEFRRQMGRTPREYREHYCRAGR
jgi:AraC-like DNA-binding protein